MPVLIYLMTVVIPIGFRAGPLYMTTLRLFLMVMIIPLIVRLFSGRYGKVIVTDILFVLYIAWTGVSLIVNNPDTVIQQVGSVGIEFLGGYMIGRAYIRTPETFSATCRLLTLIVLCTTPFALYETMTGRPVILEMLRKLPGVSPPFDVNAEMRMNLERVQAVFAHPIHYGLFCSVAFSLCFVALTDEFSTGRRFLSSAVVLGTGFLALSSGALTALAMQLAFILWYAMFRKNEKRWWILVGLFAFAYVAVDLFSNRSPVFVFMSRATFSAHNAYWRAIIFDWGIANVFGSVEKGITGSPLFGIGLKDWIRPSFMYSGSMDNFWLVIAVRYGLPGLGLLAAGYIYVIARVMRRNFSADARLTLYRRAWVFTFLGLTFTLCTVHVWTNIYSFIFFIFGAGVWLVTVQPGDQTPAEAPAQVDPTPSGRIPRQHRPQDAAPQPPPNGGPVYSRFAHRPAAVRSTGPGLPKK